MSEFLQIAQVLADLSSLQNTVRPPLERTHSSPFPSSSQPTSQDPVAAQNLLNANKNLSSSRNLRRKSKEALLPEPPKFDKFGRRILRAPPALNRANSSFSSVNSSTAATPTGGSPEEQDIDLTRAKKLLELYQQRDKFQEMADTGLARAQARVDKVVEKYAKKELEEKEKVARARHLGV